MTDINIKGTQTGRMSSASPNPANRPHQIRDGMVFWVLWAAVEVTKTSPREQAMNLFGAFRDFYPLAGAHDRYTTKDLVRPTIVTLLEQEQDEATYYFFERVLRIIDGEDG